MRLALVAATPFQLLNALRLSESVLSGYEQVDLYVQNFSKTTERLIRRARESGRFAFVYEWNENENRDFFSDSRLILSSVFLPKNTLNSIHFKGPALSRDMYDSVTYTVGNCMETILLRLNPSAMIIAYDDGMRSYVTDTVKDFCGKWGKLGLGRIVFSGRKPSAQYLNNPGLCRFYLSDKPVRIPGLSEIDPEKADMIRTVFGYKRNPQYEGRRLVCLAGAYQDMAGVKGDGDILKRILETLEGYDTVTILRDHPRNLHPPDTGLLRDESGNSWELTCEDVINDGVILLARNSTALFIPKLMYDREPQIIFTQNIYRKTVKNGAEKTGNDPVAMMKELYRYKDRIHAPGDIKELKAVLGQLL